MQADRPLMDVQAVAEHLSVPVTWVYAKAESGELESLKIGRYVRFDPAAIDRFIEQSARGQARR